MGDDSSSSSSDDSPPRRKKRPPMFYKQYAQEDGSVHIPRSTSWRQRQKNDLDTSGPSSHVVPTTQGDSLTQPEVNSNNPDENRGVLPASYPRGSRSRENYDDASYPLEDVTEQASGSGGSLHQDLSQILNGRAYQNINYSFVEEGHSVSNFDEDENVNSDEDSGSSSAESLKCHSGIQLGNFEKLKKNFKLESPLLPNAVETSKFECLFMILNFSMQEGLSYNGTTKLLKLINSIFGADVIPDGIGVFRSLFQCDIGISYQFYCPKCFFYFGDYNSAKLNGLKCPVTGCSRIGNIQRMNDGNFFIHLPLAPQLKLFLESKDNAQELLSYRFHRDQSDNTIRDVFDGELYKKLSCNGGILSDRNNFSVTINTDGSPVFTSVANSMWPVQARINELPPQERFDSSNMFVCGIWFGASEPNMNVFLAPYVSESCCLYDRGFKWKLFNEIEITSRVITLNCCLDSRAKPDVQCFKQLHSYSGCSYCYHPGNLVNLSKNELVIELGDEEGEDILEDLQADVDLVNEQLGDEGKRKREVKAVRYCVSRDGFPPPRTDKELRGDMATSHENNIVTRGVVGISVLTLLPDFDMVNGFVIDYMHAVLLGVVKMLLKLWIDAKFSKQPYSIRSKVHQINGRLLNFSPPTNISRRPRNIVDFIHWKANELRAWLYFYGLCALEGILPDVYLKHFSLLVSAMSILTSECILETELDQANRYLLLFVSDVEQLYGPAFMVHNVHLMSHLATCVKFSGPCWSHSAFAFETGNGVLVSLVKGTVGVMTQIANKYMTYRCIPLIFKNFSVSDRVKVFCDSLVPKRMATNASKCDGISVLGSPGISPLSPSEVNVLTSANFPIDVMCYHRMIINGVIYDSQTYPKKGARSNNTVFKTRDGKFGMIFRILIVSKVVYVILKDIIIENIPIVKHDSGASSKHINVCALYPFGSLRIIRAKHILAKCVFLKYDNTCYIAEFPNTFEKD